GGTSPYTDPTSPQFVLNPAGPNFMAIVDKNGTRYGFLPAPIRAPLKVLTAGLAAAAAAGFHGQSPLGVAKTGTLAERNAAGQALYNRAAGPWRAFPLPQTGNVNYFGPHTWGDVPGSLAAGATPLVVSPLIQHPPHDLGQALTGLERSAGQFVGIFTTPASPAQLHNLARDRAAVGKGYQGYADAIAHGTPADVRAINADPAVQAAERAREDQATGALKGFYLRRDQINIQQSVSDGQLQAGQITGADWRAAYDKTEQEIHDAVRDYLSNMPSGNQDPLLQQYAAQGKQFVGADGRITDTQGYYNALDAWKASLSPADQQKLDNLLQPSAAPSLVVQEYRDTTQAL
ncbi:MAG: hypothetical protein KGI06_06395, partial [Candidatus Micrarchaeota archaeon]|nr:hypothetical protein [Candidatus Micrarchaeota archaeon]